MNAKRDHLPELDGLRGVAVLLVLWEHLPPIAHIPEAPRGTGGFGVDLFFALSGFLITRILLYNRQHGIGFWHFYRRRILRIFPAYYAMLGFVALYFGTEGLGWAATYTFNFAHINADPINHTWSLCIEEHFYLVWPFLVLGLSPAWGRRACFYGLAFVAASLLLFETYSVWEGRTWAMGSWTFFRMGTLLLGAAVAYFEPHLRDKRLGLLVSAGGATLAWLTLTLLDSAASTWGFRATKASSVLWQACAAACILLALLSGQVKLIGWAARLPWLRWTGKISYGIYLYHPLVYAIVGISGVAMAALAVGLTFAVAWLSHTYFEQPLIQWGRRLEQAGAPSQGASLPA